MSLLEDVFLEDEAGEAQELERIIEGDEYEDGPRPSTPNSDDDSEKEDEAEEDKRRVDPTSAKPKRIVKNPRVILNPARLTGPRGIQVLPEHFKDFTFKGKGHEKEDLDMVLKKLEHWAYRLYPKFGFKDCLKKMETLGKKRPVMVHLTKIRTDQFISEETVVQRDSSGDEAPAAPEEDEFDKLLQQQIDLARATPAPGTVKKGFTTPSEKSHIMPKATSSPSINEEQRERMLRNRQLAEERRLARLKLNNSQNSHEKSNNNSDTISCDNSTNNTAEDVLNDKNVSVDERRDREKASKNYSDDKNENFKDLDIRDSEDVKIVKNNRSNVMDSSDSEDDALVINESVSVDIHTDRNYDSDNNCDSDGDEVNKENNVDKNTDFERNSDIVNQNVTTPNEDVDSQNKQVDYKHLSQIEKENNELHFKNKDSLQDIVGLRNDVQMKDIEDINKSRSKDKDLADLTKDANTENVHVIENISGNNKLQTESNDIAAFVDKEISGNVVLNTNQPSENTKLGKTNDTIIEEMDGMDVDFSEEF